MKILAVDTTATAASAAIISDGKLLSESFTNTGLTHSQTLMPMIDNTVKGANLDIKDVDAFAVNNGPGSFTGVRIGVAAVKGMAQMLKKPCVEVSTLESLAYNLIDNNCIAVCAMDARCQQVYTASFDCEASVVTRLCDDEAIAISDLQERLENYKKNVIFVGDGAMLCYNYYKDKLPCSVISEGRRHQKALSTALVAALKIEKGETVSANELMPSYLRLPQAQRELKKKTEQKENLK